MIQDAATMDRPVSKDRSLRRRMRWPGLALLTLLAGVLGVRPGIRWLRSERTIALSRVRLGTVVRGDLQRDVSVQGRVVAAFHPTTSSPANGIISLKVRAGDAVRQGQLLAVVASPEPNSRLGQERSTKAEGILNRVEYERAQDELRRAELAWRTRERRPGWRRRPSSSRRGPVLSPYNVIGCCFSILKGKSRRYQSGHRWRARCPALTCRTKAR